MFEQYQGVPSPTQKRAIGINLVIFFLFALTAVALLTRTAVAANAINRDVKSAIVPVTADIDENLKHLPILDETARITSQISTAAKPLSGYTGKVADATTRIDKNLASTDTHVKSIGVSVNGIKGSTGVIKPGIAQAGGTVDTIHSKAGGIQNSLGSVANLSGSIVSNLTSAENYLSNVLGATVPLHASTSGILASAGSINTHVTNLDTSSAVLQITNLLSSLTAPLSGVTAPTAPATAGGTTGTATAPTTAAPTAGGLPTIASDPLGVVGLLGNLLGGI